MGHKCQTKVLVLTQNCQLCTSFQKRKYNQSLNITTGQFVGHQKTASKKKTLGDSFKCRMLLESTLHPSCFYVKLQKRKTKLCGVKQPKHLFFRGRIIFQDTKAQITHYGTKLNTVKELNTHFEGPNRYPFKKKEKV